MNSFLHNNRGIFFMVIFATGLESLTTPLLKIGGRYSFLSVEYIFFFLAALFVLVIYAIIWQLILEKVPLTTAYLRKGLSYVLVLVWAVLLFHETITSQQILGIFIIFIGMVVSLLDEY